jgi:large subunit ribosomal protein L22
LAQLSFVSGKAAQLTHKLLKSAVANAVSNNGAEEKNLRVKQLRVNEGLKFKRHQPVSRGSAHPFVKRNSHLTVVVEEIVPSTKKKEIKKEDIKTLSVEELAGRDRDEGVKVQERGKQTGTKGADAPVSKKTEAYQKVKMQQQGGDKAKTHRRKTI